MEFENLYKKKNQMKYWGSLSVLTVSPLDLNFHRGFFIDKMSILYLFLEIQQKSKQETIF